MTKITKHQIPLITEESLCKVGLNPRDFPDLPMKILISGAIELDNEDIDRLESNYLEMVVIGSSTKHGTRTSGRHVNVFSLAGVVLLATSAQPTFSSFVILLIAFLGACTVSLSPEQSAFFLAAKELENSGSPTTAAAYAESMRRLLSQETYTISSLLVVVNNLKAMGVDVSVGALPNQIIHHRESSVFLPSV